MPMKKRKKTILIIIGVLLLIIALVSLLALPEDTQNPPQYSVREQPQGISTKPASNALKTVKITPKSGEIVRDYSDTIYIEFNKPINLETLKYTISPEISLKVTTFDKPKTLQIFPDKILWAKGTTYLLNITELESTSGEKLEEPINIIYTNDPDENLPLGDPAPEGFQN